MIRIDKRDPEKIRQIIEWCQADDFWQNNILSTGKLREQFDQLGLKMRGDKKSRNEEVIRRFLEKDEEEEEK
ncbi:MAG: hypothetical protein DDT19_02862 [Syntrophomonadaceae bacterium]|nr:hypothetical protein [Bacillota bacterium]